MTGCINEHDSGNCCEHGDYSRNCYFCKIYKKLNELDNKIENLRLLVNSLDHHRFNTVSTLSKLTKRINDCENNLDRRVGRLECEIDKNASPHFDHDDYRELKNMISSLQDKLCK